MSECEVTLKIKERPETVLLLASDKSKKKCVCKTINCGSKANYWLANHLTAKYYQPPFRKRRE